MGGSDNWKYSHLSLKFGLGLSLAKAWFWGFIVPTLNWHQGTPNTFSWLKLKPPEFYSACLTFDLYWPENLNQILTQPHNQILTSLRQTLQCLLTNTLDSADRIHFELKQEWLKSITSSHFLETDWLTDFMSKFCMTYTFAFLSINHDAGLVDCFWHWLTDLLISRDIVQCFMSSHFVRSCGYSLYYILSKSSSYVQ